MYVISCNNMDISPVTKFQYLLHWISRADCVIFCHSWSLPGEYFAGKVIAMYARHIFLENKILILVFLGLTVKTMIDQT